MARAREKGAPVLGRDLSDRLGQREVRIDTPDRDTVILRNVPVNERFFNKPRTNVLLKRSQDGAPFLALVDEDLEYAGSDMALARTFAAAPTQAGWRAILAVHSPADLQTAVSQALCAVGFDGQEPVLPIGKPPTEMGRGGLLATFGIDLSLRVKEGNGEPTVGREEEIMETASTVLRWGQARMAVVVGESGAGKSNLLWGVAEKLARSRPESRVVSVDLSVMMAGTMFPSERENLLTSVLAEAISEPGLVLCLERAEIVQNDSGIMTAVLADGLDRGARLIGTVLPSGIGHLSRPPLKRRVHHVRIEETGPEETAEILRMLCERIAQHHGVGIDESCLRLSANVSQDLQGSQPGLAIALLDAAASRASLSGSTVVGLDDIFRAAESARTSNASGS